MLPSYSTAKVCNLVLNKLPGAAMNFSSAVLDPAWLGAQCCVRYTSMS